MLKCDILKQRCVLKKSLKEKIISYVYKISNQPILFRDLLEANSHYNEHMHVDAGKLGFKMNIVKAYIVYFALCTFVIMPLIAITHYFLKHLDFHISIVGSVLVTSAVFIGFSFFEHG